MRQLILILLLVPALVFGAAQGISNDDNSAVPGRIVVQFTAQFNENSVLSIKEDPAVRQIFSATGGIDLKNVLSGSAVSEYSAAVEKLTRTFYYTYNSDHSPQAVAAEFRKLPGVAYAEVLKIYSLAENPNDPSYGLQSFFPVISAPQAWDSVKGEQGTTVVAVVDGGTDLDHPDLAGNFWVNPGEIAGNGIDDDGNGFTDDVNGWNFTTGEGDPTGLSWQTLNADHGTHTGGLISALTNNNVGIAGAGWNVKLMGICAANPNSDRSIAFGYDGILYAVNNGADIVSCSWGGLGGGSLFEQDVIDYAHSQGVAVIAAAGNDNVNGYFYPSAYKNAFGVAATTNSDLKASFSNYGTWVDFAAPGVSIYSLLNNGSYGYSSGTSMACPLLAGVVALAHTNNPGWTGVQAAEQVRVSADSIDSINPVYAGLLGKGRVNALRAVSDISPSLRISGVSFDDGGDGIIDPGETITLDISIKNYLNPASGINLNIATTDPYVNVTSGFATIGAIGTMDEVIAGPFTVEIDPAAPSGHPVHFSMNLTSAGYNDIDEFSLTILPTFANAGINNIALSVTNVGRIGFADAENQVSGMGFKYKNGENLMYEGALMAGIASNKISNAARGRTDQTGALIYDADFDVSVGGDLQLFTPGNLTEQESVGIFEDTGNPVGQDVRITQETYADTMAAYADFVIFKYIIENTTQEMISNYHFGMFFDWDIDGQNYSTNVAAVDTSRKLAYAYDSGTGPQEYVGTSILTSGNLNYRAIMNDGTMGDFGIYDGYTDLEKWQSLSGGVSVDSAGPGDVSLAVSSGPHEIAAGGQLTIAFAMLAGDDLNALRSHADSALSFYNQLFWTSIDHKEHPELPARFVLNQNYPNPFNPGTEISFSIEKIGLVQLQIFDVLGRKIKTLLDREMNRGNHNVRWDGRDDFGNTVSAGTYYYRLQSGSGESIRKMILLK